MSKPVIRVTDFHAGHFCLGTGTGFHATPCMSQAYGKTAGWAFNANKWNLNLY